MLPFWGNRLFEQLSPGWWDEKSNRSINNSSVDALRPQYRSILLLDLTQLLLRDFGTGVKLIFV